MRTIAIDAMGGDFGSLPIVDGTVHALKKSKHKFRVIMVGDSSTFAHRIPKRLMKYVEFLECDDVFGMEESATDVLKRKESTIYKAIELVKNNQADAVVSAGHSGATMSLATLRLGRVPGVLRPAIATMMPTETGSRSLILDAGANTDCKADNLLQFAIMGEAYQKEVLQVDKIRVGLLANGEEDSKGNELTKEAFGLLKQLPSFIGNVEGGDIFNGSCDVIVCDGFTGNIVLKASEGVASSISKLIKQNIRKSPTALTGALLMRRVFKLLKKQMDYAEYGGAPLIGVNGCTIICHGKSNPKAIKNAIFQALTFVDSNVNQDIQNKIEQYQK